jgi:hypothetical protein
VPQKSKHLPLHTLRGVLELLEQRFTHC